VWQVLCEVLLHLGTVEEQEGMWEEEIVVGEVL
jgi:hypothetical protein